MPLLAFLCFRISYPLVTFLGLVLGIAGVGVLMGIDTQPDLGWGEALTLVASILFAVQILQLDRWGKSIRSAHLTVGLVALTGLPALAIAVVWAAFGPGLYQWLDWTFFMISKPRILAGLGLMAVLCTVLAFHWMNVYQPQVTAGRAALIYLLEPVFTTFVSIPLGHDEFSWRLVAGGALVLAGNLLTDLPLLRRRATG